MTDDQIIRRNDVYKLLQETADKKSSLGGTSDALDRAENAYEIANKPERLGLPWPQLAAYRLAHLMLRSEDADSQLALIDRRFEEAAELTQTLGPLPLIYRLAVLHRLANQTENKSNTLRDQLGKVFHQAGEAIKKAGNRNWKDIGADPTRKTRGGPIQNSTFNMLELASYFLGNPYRALEGLGAITDPLDSTYQPRNGQAWILVGPNPDISTVQMCKKVALEELEEFGRRNPDAVLFKLELQKPLRGRETDQSLSSRYAPDRHIKKANPPVWGKLNRDQRRMLAIILRTSDISHDDLRTALNTNRREALSDENFRQIRSRLNNYLKNMTHNEVVKADLTASDSTDEFQLRKLPIYGAVQIQCIPRRFR